MGDVTLTQSDLRKLVYSSESGSRLRIDHPSQTAVSKLPCVTKISFDVNFECDTAAKRILHSVMNGATAGKLVVTAGSDQCLRAPCQSESLVAVDIPKRHEKPERNDSEFGSTCVENTFGLDGHGQDFQGLSP